MASESDQQLAGGSALLAVSRVWSQVASGLLFLATSTAINPSEFGDFAIATSIYGALAVCVGQGTYEYVIKARESANAAPTVFFLNMGSATAISLATVLICLLVPLIVPGQNIPKILMLLVPAYFLAALTTLMESVIMKRGAITQVGRATIIADTISLAAALGSLMAGAGVLSLVVQRLTRELVIAVTYGLSNSWVARLAFDMPEARRAISFARTIVGTRIMGLGSTAVIDLTIGATMGTSDAGIFRLVARLLNIGSDILFQPFRTALWVRLPPLQDDLAAFKKAALELLEIFGVGLFAAMAGMALIAAPMFALMFDPEWQRAVPIVAILALGRVLLVPGLQSEVVFALRNQMPLLIRASVVSTLLSIIAIQLAAPLGLFAYAVATVIITVLFQIYIVPIMARCIDMKVAPYVLLMGRLSLNALAMIVVVAPMMALESRLGASDWLMAGSAIAVGAATYILAARKFTPEGYAAYEAGVVSAWKSVRRFAGRFA